MRKLLFTLLLFSSILNAKIGLEIGYLTFNTSTLIVDKYNGVTDTVTNKGSGTDYSLFIKTSNNTHNINLKIGTTVFTKEPIASAQQVGLKESAWSPNSDSITHIEVGYSYNFLTKNKLYPSIFGDIGFYHFQYSNKNLEKIADDTTGLMYMDDFQGDTFSSLTQASEMKLDEGFFIDFGVSLNYEIKNLTFQLLGKFNSITINKYEGIYQIESSRYSVGASAHKILGFEHTVTIEPALYFSIAYKL